MSEPTPPPRPVTGRTPRSTRRLLQPPRLRRRAALREVAYLSGLLASAGAIYAVLVLLPSRLKTDELRVHRDHLTREVDQLKETAKILDRDARALEDDPWAVENALRQRLGYLRPGERAFLSPR